MKKIVCSLTFSVICAFGLGLEEMLEAYTNGIMMGVCGGGEEIAAKIRISNGIDMEKAIDVERLKMCGKVTFEEPPAKRKYNETEKKEWDRIYERSVEIGKKAFYDLWGN